MEGWIKVHRSITNHWVFSDAEKLKAWITILLNVNHEEIKVNLGNEIFICGRGESLKSLDSWAKLFGKNWNKSKVRRFFELLKNDSMIVLKSEHITTRLTVCKYDNYQDDRNADETQMKRKRNASETQTTPNKNEKNDKNEKNIYRSFSHLKISNEENEKLINLGYSQKQLDEVYDSIENYKNNTKYKSLYLTAKKWIKKEDISKPLTRKVINLNNLSDDEIK